MERANQTAADRQTDKTDASSNKTTADFDTDTDTDTLAKAMAKGYAKKVGT